MSFTIVNFGWGGGDIHISVPSGNFGNVCAAMIGSVIGLPIAKLSATTNQNDTVPRFMSSGQWQPTIEIFKHHWKNSK